MTKLEKNILEDFKEKIVAKYSGKKATTESVSHLARDVLKLQRYWIERYWDENNPEFNLWLSSYLMGLQHMLMYGGKFD